MTTVEYKFKKETDFAFYILNAVAHDFIHDFNNYGRMGKILNYIMGLVDFGRQGQQMAQAVTNLSLSESTDRMPEPVLRPEYSSATSDEPINLDSPSLEPVSVNDEVVVPAPTDTFTNIPTSVLCVSQMENNYSEPISRLDISSDSAGLIQNIVNTNIQAYNNIMLDVNPKKSILRSTTKKINILQRLKDFIQESKFLIISKFRSGRLINVRTSTSTTGVKRKILQTGGGGLDIITKDVIIQSIKDIIEEINETDPQNLKLISFFEYIMHSYLYLSIQNLSALEIFNNSLIEENACIFIIGQCNNNNIREQARLGLSALLNTSKTTIPSYDRAAGIKDLQKLNLLGPYKYKSRVPMTRLPEIYSTGIAVAAGGGLNMTEFKRQKDSGITQVFEQHIEDFKSEHRIYAWYSQGGGNVSIEDYEDFYKDYTWFFRNTSLNSFFELVIGKQMMNVKKTVINNEFERAKRPGRNQLKSCQLMLDAIVYLIFTNCIEVYQDIKNRASAQMEDSGDGSAIKGEAKLSVQNISRLVAKKVLEFTDLRLSNPSFDPKRVTTLSSNTDLDTEIFILNNVAMNDKGYTSVDDILIQYFIRYNNSNSIMTGERANDLLHKQIRSCSKSTCRLINNAVPSDTKELIDNIVICPTSSVCDGMASFGSCVNPGNKKEYANMNFSISYNEETPDMYYGETNLKPNLSAVNINYGIKYKALEIYNGNIEISLESQPILLQANYVFKNLINRIIEIWKTSSVIDIGSLWALLENNDYFLSILKLGSQKAIGDIFQEINGTLENGGYSVPVQNLVNKKTYVIGGDRPSGVRVVKILKDDDSGKNSKANGGYVGGDYTLLYFSSATRGGKNKTKKNKKKKYKRQTNKNRKYITRR
jgi:hypothetical protein